MGNENDGIIRSFFAAGRFFYFRMNFLFLFDTSFSCLDARCPCKWMNFNARKAYISLGKFSAIHFIGVEAIGPAVTVSASTIPFELA